jgi:hypothetical protein
MLAAPSSISGSRSVVIMASGAVRKIYMDRFVWSPDELITNFRSFSPGIYRAKSALPIFSPKTALRARGNWPSRLGSRPSRLCQV